jgi:hypothetical protein
MGIVKIWVGLVMALLLAACGGGGGDSGDSMYGGGSGGGTSGGSDTAVTPKVTLVLSQSSVTSATAVIATATVKSTTGTALSGVTVRFSTTKSLVTLDSDTATTDASGVATVTLSAAPGQAYGADTLTASVTVNSTAATATQSFTANGATSIEILADSNSAPTAGNMTSNQVTLTAIVKGAGNVGMANAPVTFTTDAGTLLTPATATNESGVASVKFTAGGDKSNRTAVIRVSSGAASASHSLPVEGTKLSVSGATTLALSTSGTLSVKAVDSSGQPISGATVRASSSLGNGLSATQVTTDTQGLASIAYSANRAGSDTVTFTGLGATATSSVVISSEDFSFVLPTSLTEIPVGSSQAVQVRYRVGGVGQAGRMVNFASTGGQLSSATATTDAQGIASVSISSTTAAPATVQAQLTTGTAQATLPVVFVAKTPARLVLQVTPTAIGPNLSGATSSQAQVVAKVTDTNGNPVSGATVNFSRDADPSGGNFLQPSGLTDVNGVATVQYVAGPQSTSTNGVVLRGTAANTAVSGTAALTISQTALFIALGTGNEIKNLDSQNYQKEWTVYVTDANGVAVPNVSITAKLLPISYRKGSMVWVEDPGVWTVREWTGLTRTDSYGGIALEHGYYFSCANEDSRHGEADAKSFNGVLDDTTEDVNRNGTLEPGNVISLVNGSVRTDSFGRATLTLTYAESYVPWVVVKLQVQAVVSGTASVTTANFTVPGTAEDFTDDKIPPAGLYSPYGQRPSCNDPL